MRINTFDDYQVAAAHTAIYPEEIQVLYPALGLAGEAGEVANKVKKIYRDDDGTTTEKRRQQIAEELGGVLWYIAAICTDLGLNMGDVARRNMEILASRCERGTLTGDGDER
jgi:NTP pyrophosphatase (non-canonical NTP hydrolase)